MNLLVVSECFWPEGGGGEFATYLIVDLLSREFEITVVTGTKDPSRLQRVSYVYEPLLSKWEKPILWFNTLKLIRTKRFRKLVKEADVLYIPGFAYPVIPFAKRVGKKVIVHLHGFIPISYTATVLAPYEKHKNRITRDDVFLECMKGPRYCLGVGLFWWLPRLARRWVLQADKVICVSRRHAEIIVDQIPELKDKIEVVYNPLPPELVDKEPRKELDDIPTFLYVGGDSYVKGFHLLLRALNWLGRQGVEARFILTNRYGLRSLRILRRLDEKYGNLEIQVVGRVKYDELLDLRRGVWALVFPSVWEETFGYAVVEASLLGEVPVASRVGGVLELLGDTIVSRYMFAPGVLTEFVEKLVGVCSLGVEEVKTFGLELRREVLSKLNPGRIGDAVVHVFKGVVNDL